MSKSKSCLCFLGEKFKIILHDEGLVIFYLLTTVRCCFFLLSTVGLGDSYNFVWKLKPFFLLINRHEYVWDIYQPEKGAKKKEKKVTWEIEQIVQLSDKWQDNCESLWKITLLNN